MNLNQRKTPTFSLLASVFGVAFIFASLILIASLNDLSRTGPEIREEILQHYSDYLIYALLRLTVWSMLILAFIGSIGALSYYALTLVFNWRYRWPLALIAISSSIVLLCSLQFCRLLLHAPGAITASFSYRISRLYPLWEQLSPGLITAIDRTLIAGFSLLILAALIRCWRQRYWLNGSCIAGYSLLITIIIYGSLNTQEPTPTQSAFIDPLRPNILLIGSDTLRADRIGASRNKLPLTPNISKLIKSSTQFTQAYVPIARTAPSLVALFTGTWPTTNGIRNNFISDEEATLSSPSAIKALSEAGYYTAAIGDWAAADLSKFDLGFDYLDVPDDQWNLKYLLRQGPKQLRLFLTLFAHNNFGKTFLPEIYFLANTPLTSETGRAFRHEIAKAAQQQRPFLLNLFVSSNHEPFASNYPFYNRYANPQYQGESRFAMAGLTSPKEIIDLQEREKAYFDVQQIIDLYDGATANFDDEVGKIMRFLKASQLDQNTVVIIYSDHGTDLFEQKTWGQGNILSDFSYQIPLIFSDPRRPKQQQINTTVRSIDLAPTLLELAGLTVPANMDGASLIPVMEGSEPLDRPAYQETGIWFGEVPGLPKNRIRYPSLLELLEVDNKESGTIGLKKMYRQKINQAKLKGIRLGDWQLLYFPDLTGGQYQLFHAKSDSLRKINVMETATEAPIEVMMRALQQRLSAEPSVTLIH